MNSLKYIIEETYFAIKKSGTLIINAVLIITAALSLFGVLMIADKATKLLFQNFETNLEIIAFLEDQTDPATLNNVIIPNISAYPEVGNVKLVSKEEAAEALKKDMPELREIFSVIEENPLPVTLRIKVKSAAMLEAVTAKIKKENGLLIEDVTYGGDKISSFLETGEKIKRALLLFVIVFIVSSIAIVSSTIKMTVHSRRNEIEIMQLTGATEWYIKWPYVIEGTFIGIISAVLATVLVYFMQNAMVTEFARNFAFVKNLPSNLSYYEILFKLLIIGVLQGIIGALISTSRYLSEKNR
ncbi:MAG: permease-like cell division protein FtsX [Candidatus Wallbacteria bacterium]